MRKEVLLICPHSALEIFKESKISIVIPHIPYVSLASLAGALLAGGHGVHILDLSISKNPLVDLEQKLKVYQPDFVGVTFTTGLCSEAAAIAKKVRELCGLAKLIAGGAHPSVFPAEPIEKYGFDFSVFGEGELTLSELVSGRDVSAIDGLAYRGADGQVVINSPRALIGDLDDLPPPAYQLYNAKNYHSPKVASRRSPVAAIETSRGCPYSCIYCNKHIFQTKFRAKSPRRVVDEMEILLNLGYKEIHVWDDCFSADLNHAKGVCDEIVRRGVKVNWNVYNGIRVDRVDEELLCKLMAAGCYRLSFGIESGDQAVLNLSQKGITLEQIKNAVRLANQVGIETLGFFMVGLPGETKETFEKTVALAKELDLDLPKIAIATPLPGTKFFDDWREKGLIKSYNWPDYVLHTKKRVASHPNIGDEEMFKYYNLFYRQLYLRPSFIAKRFWRGLRTGEIFFDIYYFLKVFIGFKW
ncbi:MAG: radical SAM protein [Patescibacteria group bacterium]